jgi:hypothetical protein
MQVEGSNVMEVVTSHAEKGVRIPERRIREWLVQICHALYYIHKKKNITHRDLTPNNILLATEQVVQFVWIILQDIQMQRAAPPPRRPVVTRRARRRPAGPDQRGECAAPRAGRLRPRAPASVGEFGDGVRGGDAHLLLP